MADPFVASRGTRGNPIFGVALGALLGLITLVVPIASWLVVPVLLAAIAGILLSRPIRYDRLSTFGGILIGGGASWAYGVVNTVLACVGTSDFCGKADVMPMTIVAAALLAIGGLVAVRAGRQARP